MPNALTSTGLTLGEGTAVEIVRMGNSDILYTGLQNTERYVVTPTTTQTVNVTRGGEYSMTFPSISLGSGMKCLVLHCLNPNNYGDFQIQIKAPASGSYYYQSVPYSEYMWSGYVTVSGSGWTSVYGGREFYQI